MSTCQRCNRNIADTEARYMYVSPVMTKVRLDKCQGCGEWTQQEQALVDRKLTAYVASQQAIPSKNVSGCNCTGQR